MNGVYQTDKCGAFEGSARQTAPDTGTAAEQTGISKSALGSYEANDDIELSPLSVTTLTRFYGVSTDYLLGMTGTKNHPNTELHELGLSDGIIELLRSVKLNNRLLYGLATHGGCRRFLTDMEIYVDRIADMRVNDMNALLKATRRTILEKHDVGEDDYFSHVMHKDLDVIARDVRDAHRKDTTTANVA